MLMVPLGPVLWAQGKHVRKTTPLLPEPPGERSGEEGQGPLLRLLIVGDSSAAGVGASHQDEALLGHLVSGLATNHRVEFRLVAATGSTTLGSVRRLGKLPAETFDVAVTVLGVNDSTRLSSVGKFLDDQSQLMSLLKEKFGVSLVVCSGLPPMHLFPALPQPLRWVIGRKARSLDGALEHWLASQPNANYLKSDFTLDAELMASDGFHPGPEVYRMWGQAMVQRIGHLLEDIPLPKQQGKNEIHRINDCF